MKITIFTSNRLRHNYFIQEMNKICDELFVFQESVSLFPGKYSNIYDKSKVIEDYFDSVKEAEKKIFTNNYIKPEKFFFLKNMLANDLKYLNFSDYKNFFNSDIYIVFGSSFIKGEILKFLIEKKAINLHMGISPYYRGCDCNFWALYDNRPDMVGSTIHLLSDKLDAGDILYHAVPSVNKDPFIYSMLSVKSAISSLSERVLNEEIFKFKPVKQNKSLELRYSTKKDFSEIILKKFLNKKIISIKSYNYKKYLINPYILENDKKYD